VAVEAAGIWPSVVDLEPRQTFYVLVYHGSDGEDRVLTAGSRAFRFHDVESLNLFILGPHIGVPSDVHLALEVLSSLSPEGLEPELFPRNLVAHSLMWICGGAMLTSEGQIQRLLDTLAFLNDWHNSLNETGMVAEWPVALDDVAEMLAGVVVHHHITVQEAAEDLERRNLKSTLSREVTRLLQWTD
jgi:hypothetical protein